MLEVFDILIIVCLVCIGISAVIIPIGRESLRKKAAENKAEQEALITQMGITKSADHEWRSGESYYRFIADDVAQKVYICAGLKKAEFTCIPYGKIRGFEAITGTMEIGSFRRSLIGSLLGGFAGGFIGAMATDTILVSCKAELRLDDAEIPDYVFDFYDFSALKTGPPKDLYTETNAFVNSVKRTVYDRILPVKREAKRQADQKTALPVRQKAAADPSPAEDITEKLKTLRNLYLKDLITDEEYAAKKAELLKRL